MQEPENQSAEPKPEPEKKHNLGAKIAVAFALGGFIGGKLTIPGLVIDLNNMFPKGTSVGEKFKRTFSKDVIPLVEKAVAQEMKVNGRGPIMAFLMATKWSTIFPTVGGIILAVIGWKRADRIKDSKDIYKHPIKSTKIILGLEEPEPTKPKAEAKGKHTEAVITERTREAEAPLQR